MIKPPVDLNSLTLQKLLDDDAELKQLFETAFAVVKEDVNLAICKQAMDLIQGCQDIFVTKNGKRDEPILGWLTNVMIAEKAQL